MKSCILFWTIAEIKKGENLGQAINFDYKDNLSELVWSLNDNSEFYHEWYIYTQPKEYL